MHPKLRHLVALLLAFALIAAACGDDDTTSNPTTDETPTAEASPEETATTDPAPAETTPEEDPDAEVMTPADPSLDPFVIGHVNMDSGLVAFPDVTTGAELAVEYLNDIGGIDGHPIELKVCSVTLDPTDNQGCAEEMANDDDVQMVVSGFVILSALFHPTYGASGKPHLGGQPLSAVDFGAENTYYYQAGNPGIIGGLGIFALTTLDPTIEKAAIIATDNEAGLASEALLKPILEGFGVEVTTAFVSDGEADYLTPITASGADKADAFFMLSDQAGCINTANALDQLDLDVPVLTTGLCGAAEVRASVGELTDGWYVGQNGEQLGDPNAGPEVAEYLDIVGTYADVNDPAYLGLAVGGFANIKAVATIANEVGWDNLSAETLSAGLRDFKGPAFLGAPDLECPGPAPFLSICTGKTRVYQLDAEGRATIDANNGEFVDVRAAT